MFKSNSMLMILLVTLVISSYLNIRSLTLCALVAYLTSHFTKNITIILGVALLVPFLVNARRLSEGLEDKKDASGGEVAEVFEQGKDLYELREDTFPIPSTETITPTDIFIKKADASCSDVVTNMIVETDAIKSLRLSEVKNAYKPVLISGDGKCNVDKDSLVVFDAEGDGKTIKNMVKGADNLTDIYIIVKAGDKHYVMKGGDLE